KHALLELVQDLDAGGVLVTLWRHTVGLEKSRLVRSVDTYFRSNFPLFGRQIRERQGRLLPFLNDSGSIAILVVEIFAAQRKSPLVIELIIGIAGDALPFCFAPTGRTLLLIAVVVIQDQRKLISCVE